MDNGRNSNMTEKCTYSTNICLDTIKVASHRSSTFQKPSSLALVLHAGSLLNAPPQSASTGNAIDFGMSAEESKAIGANGLKVALRSRAI